MEYKTFDQGILVKLVPKEEIFSSLEKLTQQEKISSAWIQAIGGVDYVEIGFYEPEKKDYKKTIYREDLELISLTGNLTQKEGKPFLHLHGTFGKSSYEAIVGHVLSAIVSVTAEIWITPFPESVSRVLDPKVNVFLLDLKK